MPETIALLREAEALLEAAWQQEYGPTGEDRWGIAGLLRGPQAELAKIVKAIDEGQL